MDLRGAEPAAPSDITAALCAGIELPPGAAGLRLQVVLDGTVMQSAYTACMTFPVAGSIALPSGCTTLESGGVIEGSGTPRNVVVEAAAIGRRKQARAQAGAQGTVRAAG